MKPFKSVLHFLITLASMIGFLSGWVFFAHSRKPIQPAQAQVLAPLPPLQPIQTFNSASSGLQVIQPAPVVRSFGSAFITRAS